MPNLCVKCKKPVDKSKTLCDECAPSAEITNDFPVIDDIINKNAIVRECKAARKRLFIAAIIIALIILCITLIVLGTVKFISSDSPEETLPAPVTKYITDNTDKDPEIKTIEEIYKDKINEYIDTLSQGAVPVEIDSIFIQEKLYDYGFSFRDINNDGIDEMMIGECGNNGGEFFVMYTIRNNDLLRLFTPEDSKQYYLNKDNEIITKIYEDLAEGTANKEETLADLTEAALPEDAESNTTEKPVEKVSFKIEVLTPDTVMKTTAEIFMKETETGIKWYDREDDLLFDSIDELLKSRPDIEYISFLNGESNESITEQPTDTTGIPEDTALNIETNNNIFANNSLF